MVMMFIMNKTRVIYDIDGVLIDVQASFYASIQKTIQFINTQF